MKALWAGKVAHDIDFHRISHPSVTLVRRPHVVGR